MLEYVSRGQKAFDNNKNKEITMKKLLAIFLASTVSFAVHADDHSSATPNPVETWTCVLNEGKTLDDVRKVGAMVAEVDKAAGNDVAQWIFTPFTGDMEAGRFILMTGWSSFPVMGSAFGNFFTGGAGDAVMAEWAAAATCDTRNLYMVEELHNTMDQ
jgi:hypothetical protein